jgi:hypothetical protein
MLSAVVAVGLLSLTTASGRNMQESTQRGNKADQAAAMRATQPGEHHKQLEVLAGDWDVVVTFIIGGQEHQGKVACQSTWVLGGRFLKQEYNTVAGGIPLSVLQYVGYDNQKKKFFEIKMDSMDTGVLHTEGSISDDGKTITNVGERTDPMTGKAGKLRTVTTIIDPDHYTLEWFQIGADGKDQRVVTLSHTRKK